MDAMKWVLVLLLASGCTQVAMVKGKIADGVDSYCTRVTPLERQMIRTEVNAALAEKGHEIRVWCKGDPDKP